MKIIIDTYEKLEAKEIELVRNGYKLADITRNAIIFTKWVTCINHEVQLIPAFWDANKGRV